MASEVRYLLFEPAEVVRALVNYHARLKCTLVGQVVACVPERNPNGTMRFRVALAPAIVLHGQVPGPKPEDVLVEETSMIAALILFCRDQNVPLPVGGQKCITIVGGQIGLLATLKLVQGRAAVLDRFRAFRELSDALQNGTNAPSEQAVVAPT